MRGGKIVFGTILENIKSFFAREEELSSKPKPIPEAASEVYERPQRIVEKALPQQPPKLPFSPDELREALKAPPVQQPKPAAPEIIQENITHEIAEFESALHEVHETVRPEPKPSKTTVHPITSAASIAPPTGTPQPLDESFFHEFEQFLTREGLESEGILEKDILWRMKEFHRHRQEGKEYYLYSKDVQQAIQHKLGDLKELEHRWFAKRAQADAIERELHFIETEIQAHTTDLKALVHQANVKSRLEHKAPEGYEFRLSDGRKLTNLLDLRVALHKMPDTMFTSHVNAAKNDFATWVRYAMNDPLLADQMEHIRDKQQLEVFLGKLGAQ